MTVKIKDKELVQIFRSVMGYNADSTWRTWKFMDEIINGKFSLHDPEEVKKVVKAILDGEEVELEERRYALRAKNVKDEDGDDIYLRNYCGVLGITSATNVCTDSEWKKLFNCSPYMHREDFEEVKDA